MFTFLKNLFRREKLDYEALMKRKAIIVDVRTPQEFLQGHADNSINIPLSDFEKELEKIKQKDKPVIICCRSGARAGKALTSCKKVGMEAYNAGSWQQVQSAINSL